MRNELELIATIERYLKDEMTSGEKAAFIEEINKDPKLQEEVAIQREVMKGIERAATQQWVKKAGKRFSRGRNFTRWGMGGLCALAIIAAMVYFNQKTGEGAGTYAGKVLPVYNESGGRDWADADRSLTAQIYLLDAGRDTVIETKGGIVLSVPANGFMGDGRQSVKGKVELVVKEALDAASIVRSGLSTQSGGRLLETGGMFFVDARQGGKTVRIDPSHGIYAIIPTDTVKPGMQLFSGKRTPGGGIDWVNPKSLEHGLVAMDIHTMDLYPPHYLDSLRKWGYDAGDKVFTDSLYYSFAQYFGRPAAGGQYDTIMEEATDSSARPGDMGRVSRPDMICGINPAKIKAIWGEEFQNTLIATREFEQRISVIHKCGDNRILDLYVNNLDKDLYRIDSMAAKQVSGGLKAQFRAFAARKDGKLMHGVRQFDKLKEYYQRKAKAFTEAIAKTQQEYWGQQAALDRSADTKRVDHQNDSSNRVHLNFTEEFRLNLREAYKQLGYEMGSNRLPWSPNAYTVPVKSLGWCNVDRYVEESVRSRTTMNFTDSVTNRKAVIQYQPASFQVEGSKEYNRLYVYLLPDKLRSFMRLNGSNGRYTEKLNELMRYQLVCVAYKDEQAFFYSQQDVQPRDYVHIALRGIGKEELNQELSGLGSGTQASDLQAENSYFRFEIGDQKRQNGNRALLELRERVATVIFPCEVFGAK